MCSVVRILLELRYMLHTTLKLGTDLQMFDPRKPAAKNHDIYDETSYDKQYIQNAKLKAMVQAVRVQLRKAIVKRFLHMSDYAWKKRLTVRNYMLDMYLQRLYVYSRRSGTETSSLCSVLGKIVQSAPDIHSNCEEHTLLVIVVENKPLGVVAQLFHDRTSKHVKFFTLWHGHESLHILVVSRIDW